MRKNILLASALAFLLSASAFAEGVNVKVNGMVCAFCVQGIKKKLEGDPNVESCKVDLDTKVVEVKFKKDKSLTDDEVKRLIKEAGYSVDRLDRFN
jgi:periplasmic mercuric ion binding protein